MFLLQKKTIKAPLSIADGRASSFFNTCINIITPQPLRGSGISGAKIRRKTEICRENRRKIEINRENLAAFVSNHIYIMSDVSRSLFVPLLMRKPGA